MRISLELGDFCEVYRGRGETLLGASREGYGMDLLKVMQIKWEEFYNRVGFSVIKVIMLGL